MEFWEKSEYKKWYLSHRRFSFTSRHLIELLFGLALRASTLN